MSATASLNGKPRTQLSDQLDRLDGILDVLGDGLTAAVADAMKAGTAVAVKEALVEILTNPDLLAALRGALPMTAGDLTPVGPHGVPTPAGPGLWARIKARLAKTRSAIAAAASRVRSRVTGVIMRVVAKARTARDRGRRVVAVARSAGLVRSMRWLGLTAVVAGAMSGVLTYLTPHELVAAAGAVGGAVLAAAAQVTYRARRLLRALVPIPA